MRISFLLVLALALLVGLGVVFALKTLGWLTSPPPPPPAPSPPPVVAPQVLVPTRPLFPGDAILPGDLGARPMTEAEYEDFKKNRDDYLLPNSASANYRFVKKAHPANVPLKKSDLEEIRKPTPLNERLLAETRAVNLLLPKNQAAGAMIQTGDWVDVYLTTAVGVRKADGGLLRTPELRTALIAKNAHVVAKRDSLWDLYAPLRSNEISYTLAVNPYRAALIDYARTVGAITLVPVSHAERQKLDEDSKDPAKLVEVTVGDPGRDETKYELDRIRMNDLAIGPAELARAMHLPTLPEQTVARMKQPTQVEAIFGTGKPSYYSFPTPGVEMVKLPPPEYFFLAPGSEPLKAEPAPSGGKSGVQVAPSPGVKLPS